MSLERAFRMRASNAEAEKRESIRHPVSGEEMELGEHDRTLADILQDDNEQNLFINRFLYNTNPTEAVAIAASLESGTMLSKKQTALLEKVRVDYNLRTAKIEKVREGMTPEELIRVGELDPRIKEVLGKIGPEKAAEFISTQFQELAISDKKAFERMVKALRSVHKISTGERATGLDHEITETLMSHGISEDAYFKAARGGLTLETKANLDRLVAEQFGLFRKSIDWVTKGGLSHRGGRQMYQQLEEQQKLLADCDKHRKTIGTVLRGTLTQDVNLAIQKYMLNGGELKDHKQVDNVQTIGDYKEIKHNLDERPNRWEKFKKDEAKRLNIVDLSKQPVALEEMKNRFATSEFQGQKDHRARGALAVLITLLFGSSTKDTIKSSLT